MEGPLLLTLLLLAAVHAVELLLTLVERHSESSVKILTMCGQPWTQQTLQAAAGKKVNSQCTQETGQDI